MTLDYEMELGIRNVGWQVKAISVDGAPDNSHTSTTQLRVIRVPCLSDTSFGLDAVIRFQSIDAIELALIELASYAACTREGQEHKAKG